MDIPVTISKSDVGPNLNSWVKDNKSFVESELNKKGAILFRGFKINGARHFEKLIKCFGDDPLEYVNQSTPRTEVKGNIYTSTEYPSSEVIPLHNENSYTNNWAMKLFFFCVQKAEKGGDTPIADSREVFQDIPDDVKQRFMNKRLMYVRNYGELDLPWQQVFQTDSRSHVEEICTNSGISFEWRDNGGLRTWEVCDAVKQHPTTNEYVWFNQAHLFHVSNLGETMERSLLTSVGEEGLPRNCYFGDGDPIPREDLDVIRSIYESKKVVFPWRSGDVLLLDNMLFCHGRNPYYGERQVLVGMSN